MDPSSPAGQLLARSDGLLERLERLRLQGNRRLSTDLQAELGELAGTIRGNGDTRIPVTVASAHHHVFDLQAVLMPSERAVNDSRCELGGRDDSRRGQLRPLALPARDEYAEHEAWVEAVGLTVQRAHDRWSFLSAQAAFADRLGAGLAGHLARLRSVQAEAAHANLEQLRAHAKRLVGGLPHVGAVATVPESGSLRCGDLVIETGPGPVRRRGVEIRLTPMEKRILTALSANPGRVLSRDLLLRLTHGDDPRVNLESRVVDVHIARLRQKLNSSSRIVAVAGIGYRWDDRDAGRTPEAGIATARRRFRPIIDQSRDGQLDYGVTSSQRRPVPGRAR